MGSARSGARFGWVLWALLALASGCTYEGEAPHIDGADVHLTLLHTADWHSRLTPYEFTVGATDARLGLSQDLGPFGGAARMSYLLQRERARSARVLHLDSGDCFQGAPIFNFFRGEAEMRALSLAGLDGMVIGNHEFDAGGENFSRQASRWATFPVLAANYLFEPRPEIDPTVPDLGKLAQPFAIYPVDGLRVGVIGLGNLSSLGSIFEQPNRLGIIPIETAAITQHYIDELRPQVDVIVLLSHLGLDADERVVSLTSGADVVLGGHLHIVLSPPSVVRDCAAVDDEGRHYIEVEDPIDPSAQRTRRYCRSREVIIAHSGAFMKYLGRLDVVVSNDPARNVDDYDPALDGHEVLQHRYSLFPLDSTVPEDALVAEMLEPYTQEIARLVDLELLVGYAPAVVPRFGAQGGDSALGNLIADSMLSRIGVETDFSLTNTAGIRSDLSSGPITLEDMFNVFPFDNTVAKMFVSGREAKEMFDFVARRSASRGCQAQAQIAGASVTLDCSGNGCPGGRACATEVFIGEGTQRCESDLDCCADRDGDECRVPARCSAGGRTGVRRCMQALAPDSSYELATSNYLAGGGSGFRVLQRNTTQRDTLLPMRDVLVDHMRSGPPCLSDETGELASCATDDDCPDVAVCACPDRSHFDEEGRVCRGEEEACEREVGRCVLAACRDDVARFHVERSCSTAEDALTRDRCECDAVADAGEECKLLACIDGGLGATADGRIRTRSF